MEEAEGQVSDAGQVSEVETDTEMPSLSAEQPSAEEDKPDIETALSSGVDEEQLGVSNEEDQLGVSNDENEEDSSSDDGEELVFTGFEEEEQDDIFPKVEDKSKALYEKVRDLESHHAVAVAELFALQRVPIEVPQKMMKGVGGSAVYIEKMIIKQGNKTVTYVMPKTPRNHGKKGSPGSDDGELIIDEGIGLNQRLKKKSMTSAFEKFPFSQPELQLLRRPLAAGWIRDVILKSSDGSAPGQVSYYSPDGSMIRSYKDLTVALTNYSGKALTRANFSFTARPVGGSKNEVVRRPPEDGKADLGVPGKSIVPRKRRRPDVGASLFDNQHEGDPSKRRRRRAGLPQKNTLIEKMQANDSEGGLFGISALSEIFAGMEKADAERELEEYNRMMSLMAAQENVLDALDPSGTACTVTEDGELLSRDEVLPCSIRCPGMTGKIPGLQCTRCLCLYHAECLGFPEDIDSTNFLCPNCEGEGTDDAPTGNHSPSKDAVYDFVHKMLELKSSPGSANLAASKMFQGFGKGISINKVDPSAGDTSPSNRSRRIPSIPQLTSHNLTITPLVPFGKGQIPRVPNLSPMNKSSTSIPVFKRGRGGAPSLIDSIQVCPQRQGNLSKSSQQEASGRSRQRYPIPNFGASFGTVKQPTSNIFRNYPQSVVSVGQKKFIVIPKSPPPNVMEMFEQQTTKKQVPGFGRQKKFLAEVFNYLTVKDLLKASHVNRAWRDEASKPRLWTEIRLKNTRIYDVSSFGDFVAARGTETIDFRKMLGSVSWSDLFEKLSSAPSLRTLILGGKVEELGELAQRLCPHLEIIDYPSS